MRRGNGNEQRRLDAALDRWKAKAAELLDDPPGVQKVTVAVRERAARHKALYDAVDPLLRLVRSHVRRSYREADLGDVALAAAALLYVASPIDLIPDHLPGGLRDDERVARWTSDKLQDALATYCEWEQTIGEAAGDLDADHGVDGIHSLEVRVLDAPDSALFARADATSSHDPPVAAGAFVQAAMQTQQALRPGQVMQVIGPDHLIHGLQSGAYHLVETTTGAIGTVRDSTGFVGNLRFDSNIESAASSIAGVAAGFQVASAITLQYYLARIDSQLVEIDRQVRGLRQDLLDEEKGSIDAAREASEDLEAALLAVGKLEEQDRLRLSHAEDRIDATYHSLCNKLDAFERQVGDVTGADKLEWKALSQALSDGKGVRLAQAQLLLYASVVRHRLNGLAVVVAFQESEARGRVAQDKLQREHREMLAYLARMSETFRQLHIRKEVLDEQWSFRGGPERELAEFSRDTHAVRSGLSMAPRALPPFEVKDPFVFELAVDEDGRLVQRQAVLAELRRPSTSEPVAKR